MSKTTLETFDDHTAPELANEAARVRKSQWEREELLNLIEALGEEVDVSLALLTAQSDHIKILTKALNRF